MLNDHLQALAQNGHLLPPDAVMTISGMRHDMADGLPGRLRILRRRGLRRQTKRETLVFWLWMILG